MSINHIYPLPPRAEVVNITPDMAGVWLDTREWEGQRKTSPRKIEQLAEVMKAGRFQTTHQGIAFDTDGKCIDGYHRLKAIRLSGVTVAMWVFPNESRGSFDVIDTGYARQAAQFINSARPHLAAGAVRYISAAVDPEFTPVYRNRMAMHDILVFHREWPEIENWVLTVHRMSRNIPVAVTPLLAIAAMGDRGNTPASVIDSFLEGVKHGAIADMKDPRFQLRARLIKDHKALSGSKGRRHAYALMVKAFNLHAKGEQHGRLLYQDGDHIPLPHGLTWHGEPIERREGDQAA